MTKRKGFTLVETVIVVIILAIIAFWISIGYTVVTYGGKMYNSVSNYVDAQTEAVKNQHPKVAHSPQK